MNRLVDFVIVVMFALCAVPVMAEPHVAPLKVGIDSAYPPFSYERDGGYAGFDVEIAEALCASMGRSCVFVGLPFDALLDAMREGRLDLMLGVSATEERAQYMDFSEHYFRARSMYIHRTDNAPRAGGETGKKRIGVRAGTVQMRHLQRQWGDRALLVVGPYSSILDKLCAGELDVVLTNNLAGYAFLTSERGEPFDVWGEHLASEAFPSEVRIGVRKNARELRDAVDRAITDIRFNGEYGRINRRYFSFRLY